ncbi:MAG: pyrroline-5-carboxylate reductase [Leptospiraceae bacterium]|nr:pyrroline-5-carboxylate reductase [Leptospiraceae bacterium]
MQKFCIAGLGNMGGSLARFALSAGYTVYGYDIKSSQTASLSSSALFHEKKSIEELLKEPYPLILAVKPGDVGTILSQIADNRLVVSLAAGISLAYLQENRQVKGPNIRAMPNLCLKVGEGATVLCPDHLCRESDLGFARTLFASAGLCEIISNESLLDAVTALSGSGPAYVYLFLKTLEDAAVREGLSRELARKLSRQTLKGSLALLEKTGQTNHELIEAISSPGGTTAEALATLKIEGFEGSIYKALRKAKERSREISRLFQENAQ